MKRRFLAAPVWVRILGMALTVMIAIGGLGILGARIGANTVSIDEIQEQRTASAVAACRAVQHTNQLWDNLVAVLESGQHAGTSDVVRFVASIRAIEADTRLCDIAARRVGHPIRPYLPDNR